MADRRLTIIPTRNDIPAYFFQMSLSGNLYTLKFAYNFRMQRWFMDVLDAENNELLLGLPLLIDRNITGGYSVPNQPPGVFFVLNDTDEGKEPTYQSFGTEHTLFYFDPNL